MSRSQVIAHLRSELEYRAGYGRDWKRVEYLDQPVRAGAVHEWFGERTDGVWSPPVYMLTDLARLTLTSGVVRRVVWIGRECWAYPVFLDQWRELRRASVFVDPPDSASATWAIDVALRCAQPTAVIADGRGLRLAHTRRLQLAAGAGAGVCLLARQSRELAQLSAATTRWSVTPVVTQTYRPRWSVALLRSKDRPEIGGEPPRWVVEWDHAQGAVRVPAPVDDRAPQRRAEGQEAGAGGRAFAWA